MANPHPNNTSGLVPATHAARRQSEQAVIERRAKVMALRHAGIRDQRKIGRQLGVSPATVNKDFKALNEQLQRAALADLAIERGIDVGRIEALLASVWLQAINGNLSAIDRVRGLMQDRSRLLGLDAPVRTEISGPDGEPIQIDHNITLDDEERQRRIVYLFERHGEGLAGLVPPERPRLDAPTGSANGRVVDAG